MRLTGLELAGYRCFETAAVSFEPGVTVIHGANGAGKTTLLEAVLFGLYGSGALDDATLADVVTRGAEEASVHLSFVHAGGAYELEREVTASGERASTRRCELREPDGEIYEGAAAVRRRVAELLRMDGEAFVNSAYVKQGEINKLLHATPAERQSMIDELLQLGRLEAYRDRADEARLAVRSLVRERTEVIDELERQRDRLADPDPYERLNALESELEQVRTTRETVQTRREELAERRSELTAELEAVADRREQREELLKRRSELQEALTSLVDRRDDIREALVSTREAHREATTTLEDHLDALDLDDVEAVDDALETVAEAIEAIGDELETHRSAVEEARERAAEAREREAAIADRLDELREERDTLAAQLEADRSAVEERQDELEAAEADLDAAVADLDIEAVTRDALEAHSGAVEDALETHREDRRELRDERAAVAEHLESATALAEADRCPTCGQPVDEAPHVVQLEEDRQQLADLETQLADLEATIEAHKTERAAVDDALEARATVDRLQELVDERSSVVDERQARFDQLEAEIESAKADREAATEAAETAQAAVEAARTQVADANERLQSRRERRSALEAASEAADRVAELDGELERLAERRDHLDELEREREQQLADVDERLEAVERALEDASVDELETSLSETESALETASERLASVEDERDELTEAIGSVRSDIERLEAVEADLDAAQTRQDRLAGLREEANELGSLYESVRADLRERNVMTLERLLNETFELLYRNDAYERIDLDLDYALAVQGKDGTELDPSQLSGGERAIFNLSLRCAIYRLLAEGVEGAAPMPPLMLDEPTVFLDQGHVGRLIRLLETMRSFGVEQTLVVSHHEALLDAAEHRIAVEKDPTTNRSTVDELATVSPP